MDTMHGIITSSSLACTRTSISIGWFSQAALGLESELSGEGLASTFELLSKVTLGSQVDKVVAAVVISSRSNVVDAAWHVQWSDHVGSLVDTDDWCWWSWHWHSWSWCWGEDLDKGLSSQQALVLSCSSGQGCSNNGRGDIRSKVLGVEELRTSLMTSPSIWLFTSKLLCCLYKWSDKDFVTKFKWMAQRLYISDSGLCLSMRSPSLTPVDQIE